MSPMMIFLRPLAFFESRTSKFVCNFALVILYDVYSLATNFADSISLIHTIAAIGRLAHEDTSLLNFFRQILKFLKSGQASNSRFPATFFREFVSFSARSGSSKRPLELLVVACISRTCTTVRTIEMYKQSAFHFGVITTQSSTTCGSGSRLIIFHLLPLKFLREISFISRFLRGLRTTPKLIPASLQLCKLFFRHFLTWKDL